MKRHFVLLATSAVLTFAAARVSAQTTTDQTAVEAAASGTSAQTLGPMTAADLGATMTTGTERFLRGNRTAGQFVGGATQGAGLLRGQTAASALSPYGQMGMGMMNPFNPMSSLYAAGMMNNLSRQRRQLRMPVTIGFEATPGMAVAAEPAKVSQRVQTRLDRIPQVRDNGSVKVEMDGQVAVLRGDVKSDRERELIARVLLLEPGIADVRNELVVTSPANSQRPIPSP